MQLHESLPPQVHAWTDAEDRSGAWIALDHAIPADQRQHIMLIARQTDALHTHVRMFPAHFVQCRRYRRTLFNSRGLARKQLRIQPAILRVLKHQHAASDRSKQNDETSDYAHPTMQPEKNAAKFHVERMARINQQVGKELRLRWLSPTLA